MRMFRTLCTVVCLVVCVGSVSAQEAAQAQQSRDLLFFVRHTSAQSVAGLVQAALGAAPGTSVTTEPVANAVLVRAPAEDLERVANLLEQIDRPPAVIAFDVTILRTTAGPDRIPAADLSGDPAKVDARIAELEKAGSVELIDRLHLTTLDNQRAQVQVGQNVFVPQPGGISGFPGRPQQRAVSYQQENIGTTVMVTPRRAGDAVVAELSVEKSWLPMAKPSVDGDDQPEPSGPAKEILQAKATLRLPAGEAVLLGGNDALAAGNRSRVAVIVTARVVGPAKDAAP